MENFKRARHSVFPHPGIGQEWNIGHGPVSVNKQNKILLIAKHVGSEDLWIAIYSGISSIFLKIYHIYMLNSKI